MHIAILFMQHDKSHKGRHVILVAGIALVSTVVVLSLPVIAAVPTMGIGVAPWLYIVPITIGWCLSAGSFVLNRSKVMVGLLSLF